jgi:hypothetical protein
MIGRMIVCWCLMIEYRRWAVSWRSEVLFWARLAVSPGKLWSRQV